MKTLALFLMLSGCTPALVDAPPTPTRACATRRTLWDDVVHLEQWHSRRKYRPGRCERVASLIFQIYEGTSQIERVIIARELFDGG